MRRAGVLIVGAALACATLSGCGAQRRTTAHTAGDVIEASDALRHQLAGSAFLAGRVGETTQVRLGFGPIENRSNDRLEPGARRAIVARAVLTPEMLDMLRSKHVVVVMPPADEAELRRFGVESPEPLGEWAATHTLSGSVRSISRAASLSGRSGLRDARRDTYFFDLSIVRLSDRVTVWTGTYEVSRVATGTLVD